MDKETENLEYAGFLIRAGANIIDSLLLAIITIPMVVGVYGWEYFSEYADVIAGPWDFLVSWVMPIVVVITFWVYRSATPGKMVFGAKIVDAKTGGNPTTGQFIGRYFAYFVSTIFLFLGFIWIIFDKRKQGWHDKLAGTVVVRPVNTGPEPVAFSD